MPYDDDEKVRYSLMGSHFGLLDIRELSQPICHQVRLRGEVHRLVAPRDQKYQSNFVEVSNQERNRVRHAERLILLRIRVARSSATTKSFTGDMRVSSSVFVWTRVTMNWHISRLYISSSRY
jgi:hypothetical protein